MLSISISGVMSSLAALYAGMKFLNKASANIVDILNQRPLPYKIKKARFNHYDICFEHVGFRYKKDVEILKNVSFTAHNKQVTALIGPSGSGKSTIINLVLRFWDRTSGSIKVGGIDIKDINPDTLTDNIAVVFQDVYLMKDTVINNIKLAKPEATFEEVRKCAEIAHCHEFISKMELGYETMIGECGATLSGGEKQRISIARALLKDAPIILLDESTSSLDADNETEINKALDLLMKDKTVIVIAHRLNTITNADKIIVIDKGEIREMGTHSELLQQNGWYAAMHASQIKANDFCIHLE